MNEARCGLLLLTGGHGARMGGTKHDRIHPTGLSWGGYLAWVFQKVCPTGPMVMLGAAMLDVPEARHLDDSRQGPAVALRHWATSAPPPARRWWILPCDQVEWSSGTFAAWLEAAERADPEGAAWCVANLGGRSQPLGGLLGAALRTRLASLMHTRVHELARSLPTLELPDALYFGRDLDTPEDLAAWRSGFGAKPGHR